MQQTKGSVLMQNGCVLVTEGVKEGMGLLGMKEVLDRAMEGALDRAFDLILHGERQEGEIVTDKDMVSDALVDHGLCQNDMLIHFCTTSVNTAGGVPGSDCGSSRGRVKERVT